MRRTVTKIISPALQFFIKHYFKKPRNYKIKGVDAIVLPGVFFPHFTHSTSQFIRFLEDCNLQDQSFLELGCGTGIISVYAAKKGAKVVASDINPQAVKNALLNAKKNPVALTAVESNLFNAVATPYFDYIIINPPYYPKAPQNMAEQAWYCGETFEYFESLFQQLPAYITATNKVYMILSEDCEYTKITAIAKLHQIEFKEISKHKKWGEWTMIYQLTKLPEGA